MIKFLKFNNSLGLQSGESKTKILPVDEISFVYYSGSNITEISMTNGTATVTTDQAAVPENAVVEAVQLAIKANPGSVVSAVNPPVGADGNRVKFRVQHNSLAQAFARSASGYSGGSGIGASNL
jgi:hypothetical protein